MIIDCHGHYTTAPRQHEGWRNEQIEVHKAGKQPPPRPSHHSISTLGSCFPTTCTVSGPCRKGDANFSGRWRAIKTAFAKSLPTGEPRSLVMTNRGERGIWQRRYWEHTIRDDCDFAAHMDYIHFNPVKHGLVAHPADWPHSSFHRCLNSGLYPAGWRSGGDQPQQTGERL